MIIKNTSGNHKEYEVEHIHDFIAIFRKIHTREEWASFTDDEIDDMDDGALDWWRKNKSKILG